MNNFHLKILIAYIFASALFFLSHNFAFACDSSSATGVTIIAGTCQPALCDPGSGVYEGYVKYTYSGTNATCTQVEWFPNSSCNINGGRASDPCPAGCDSDSQCTGLGICANSIVNTPNQICNEGIHSPGWCQIYSCGFSCNSSTGSCNEVYSTRENPAPGLGLSQSQCQSNCQIQQICDPNTWDATRCARCNSTGTGYNADGSDWGTENPAPANSWCNCANEYDTSRFNRTNYPGCFVSGSGSCRSNCSSNADCGTNLACSVPPGLTSYYCVNPNCSNESDCTCPLTTSSPTPNVPSMPISTPNPESGCIPGTTQSVCRVDVCTPGTVGNP